MRVFVDSTYPLADAAIAHQRASRGNVRGKIVLFAA
ncbi:zinc-binding dehydrogenase [Agrobacterium tumefaciens]